MSAAISWGGSWAKSRCQARAAVAGTPFRNSGTTNQLSELLEVLDRLGDAPDQNCEEHGNGDLFKGVLS